MFFIIASLKTFFYIILVLDLCLETPSYRRNNINFPTKFSDLLSFLVIFFTHYIFK